MLEQRDLDAIRNIMKEELAASENMVLKEVARVQESLDAKIEKIQKNLEEIKQFYRITKLESDNTSILLQIIGDLKKRVEELEKKTA